MKLQSHPFQSSTATYLRSITSYMIVAGLSFSVSKPLGKMASRASCSLAVTMRAKCMRASDHVVNGLPVARS